MTEIQTMEASLRGSEGRKDDGEVREKQRNGMVVMVIETVNVLSVPMVQFLSCVLSALCPPIPCVNSIWVMLCCPFVLSGLATCVALALLASEAAGPGTSGGLAPKGPAP